MIRQNQFWIYTPRNQRQAVETREHPIDCSTAHHAHSGCKHTASKCSYVVTHRASRRGNWFVVSVLALRCTWHKWWVKYGEISVTLSKVKCVGKLDENKVLNDSIGGARRWMWPRYLPYTWCGKNDARVTTETETSWAERGSETLQSTQAYIHVYTRMYTQVQTCRHTHEHIHTNVCMCEHACMHTATYIHKYLNVCFAFAHVCISYMHEQRHTYSFTHVYTSHMHAQEHADTHTNFLATSLIPILIYPVL